MKLSSSKNTAVILISLLVIVIFFALYYYVILPKKDEVQTLESSVASIKSEISNIESEITKYKQLQSKAAENEFTLRQKLPDKRNIDELILNIEELEYVTGSRIVSIDFNNYDQAVADANIINTNDENKNDTENSGTTNNEEASSGTDGKTDENNSNNNESNVQPVSSMADLSLPPSLKLITFSINVEVQNHEKLVEFIREIEKLDRIMHIDTIDYDLPGEEQEFEANPKNYLDAKIQVTTFYYAG